MKACLSADRDCDATMMPWKTEVGITNQISPSSK
jgi:hypothetical protein